MSDNYRKITDIELGAAAERERIIRLLLDNLQPDPNVTLDIIRLIRGTD
jgi:hypothetical protein